MRSDLVRLSRETKTSFMETSTHHAPGIAENIGFDLVGYHDLGGMPAFKLAIYQHANRWFLYVGHLWHRGWSVIDVTDPANPQLLRTLRGPANTWTIQAQAADGLLLTALEKPVPGWGIEEALPFEEGAQIWDIATDPADPQLVSTWRTGATGTHRNFYSGGRYAYMTATRPGFHRHLLVILDVSDPEAPVEVATWAWPTQDTANPSALDQAYLHGPAYVSGNRAYLSFGRVGLVILDISDPTAPTMVSHLDFGDLGSFLGCHSAVPLPDRNLLVVNSEAIEDGEDGQLNYVFVVDIADETHPKVISAFPLPVPHAGLDYRSYYRKGGRFGPHNQHHYQDNPAHALLREHVLLTFFNAGLRLYDVTDAWQPVEIGCFVPEDPKVRLGVLPERDLVTQFEDVLVDARGYIYCSDKNHGLFVLRTLEPLR